MYSFVLFSVTFFNLFGNQNELFLKKKKKKIEIKYVQKNFPQEIVPRKRQKNQRSFTSTDFHAKTRFTTYTAQHYIKTFMLQFLKILSV